jgi:hypothetical protein
MKVARYLFVALFTALLSTCVAVSQENSEITGTVTDPANAVVAGATVTVTSASTGAQRTTTTNSSGIYDFPGMGIGQYNMTVTAAGFETYARTGIVVNVAQTLRENVELVIGGGNQTVTVQANALQVQSETNEVSSLITGKQMLP